MVRYVAPSEAAPALADCLNSEGFEVSVRTDGNLESDSVPASQQESYAVAMWKCMAMYPYDPKFNQALTDEQIRRVYDYYVNELTPCLEDRGITVTDPPSETTFVEGYYSAPNLWTPYTNLPTLSEAQVAELYAACPAQPSDLFG
ncbi:hypothetical protein [Microbacterium kunmingense]|uniref:hypothetical protein n=1 Tax=Microbacterium kunmingense TaxID=2915939 RepID=UPI003D70D420